MPISFNIDLSDIDMNDLERSWIEFLNQQSPIIYVSHVVTKTLSIDCQRWNTAKRKAIVIDYEEIYDDSL